MSSSPPRARCVWCGRLDALTPVVIPFGGHGFRCYPSCEMTIQRAGELIDRLAPGLDGAQRHAAVWGVLDGWRPEDERDVLRWLGGTGVHALSGQRRR
jgi:hypothetical protein